MDVADTLTCFKAYDIRGRLGSELNEDIAYRIGYAFAKHLQAKTVAVGGDIRHSSHSLKLALARGLIAAGVDVIDIGMVGTEEIYFASFYLDVDGAIEVTASHNPIDFNGMKLVGQGALPISGDSGLNDIKKLAEDLSSSTDDELNTNVNDSSHYKQYSVLEPYITHLLGFIDETALIPIRLVVNAGNGAAGHVIDAIEKRLVAKKIPIEFIKVHHEADGSFPNGIPNPLLPENRAATADAVVANNADIGIAWDGDFDRCFLFDENGRFIEGYYIVGLLASTFLDKHPNEKIIHDPRLTWNTIEQVEASGGIPIQSKTGHAFIKERMRAENAIYGGEMSAHHYFRDFAYCDSGMIPWLLVLELISKTGKPLSSLVDERMAKYPCSGEINFKVDNIPDTINTITKYYSSNQSGMGQVMKEYPKHDCTDGISLEFEDWRFNLRASNTEPLIRLNMETRSDKKLLDERLNELISLINT